MEVYPCTYACSSARCAVPALGWPSHPARKLGKLDWVHRITLRHQLRHNPSAIRRKHAILAADQIQAWDVDSRQERAPINLQTKDSASLTHQASYGLVLHRILLMRYEAACAAAYTWRECSGELYLSMIASEHHDGVQIKVT